MEHKYLYNAIAVSYQLSSVKNLQGRPQSVTVLILVSMKNKLQEAVSTTNKIQPREKDYSCETPFNSFFFSANILPT
jgi:hypothetical protein